jgi:hypothetical protein
MKSRNYLVPDEKSLYLRKIRILSIKHQVVHE